MPEQDDLIRNLQRSALFQDVDPAEVERLIAAGQWRTVEQGRYVYRQGESDCRFHIIADGEAELTMDVDGGDQFLVSRIGPGGHFGETALLTNSTHSIDVRALTALSLLCFDAEAFNHELLANQVIQRRLCIGLARRLRVSYHDHAGALAKSRYPRRSSEHNLDPTFFSGPTSTAGAARGMAAGQPPESTIARQIMAAAKKFSSSLAPVLITGESGTGRRMAAYEIHRASAHGAGPYFEVDVRDFDSAQLEMELFGNERESFAFSLIDRLGVFERSQEGTVVLYNAELLEPDFQRELAGIIKRGFFTKVAGDVRIPLRSRIILICNDTPRMEDGHNRLLPTLYALVANRHFRMAPLRAHRRDIPRLIQYYLQRYSLQYGKTVTRVDDRTLGTFMNYDWPGNLAEMASVLQRAVILGRSNEALSNQVLLGMPKTEGKWEFNLLRLRAVRSFVTSRFYPLLPKALVGLCFALVLVALVFGPAAPEKNIGLTLSWVVGWPLMIFSFFFLARTWCSVCGLSVPGWLAQSVFKPERPTPAFIRRYSGWIMAGLCTLLFWIEITWNAYQSPRLTAAIITAITLGALVFSIFFKRRVWCRYLCPLGAINAIFSMPSTLELRANSHMCMNRCTDHVCYTGNDTSPGCPMFRHPFLVDNNRDCILCGQCIKNCRLDSIHLNLRLAPQELWNMQAPRLEDSILVIVLAAVFFPFAVNLKYPGLVAGWAATGNGFGLPLSPVPVSSIFFFGCILIYLGGAALLSQIMARLTGNSWKATASIIGYGMIPLVLSAFMAAHLEIFVGGLGLLPANILDLAGSGGNYGAPRIMSPDAAFVLQAITVAGGLIAALYASHRIIKRLLIARRYSLKMFAVPAFCLCLYAVVSLRLV
ncbi:MAG: sigma 54-interacting transcriptional regulator [Desulfoprunum sp.]